MRPACSYFPSTLATSILILLLTYSSFGVGITSISAASYCNTGVLGTEIVSTGSPVGQQAARLLAEKTFLFKSIVSDSNSTYVGMNNEYNIDSVSCGVYWHDVAVSYRIRSSNGSTYLLTIGENPLLSVVYGIEVRPDVVPSIAVQHSQTYSGYAVAANSAHTQEVNYSEASWVIPTVSKPSNPGCGNTPPFDCMLYAWTGLQNSTYDGPDHSVSKGEVIQTGTDGMVTCSSTCSITYDGWTAYFSFNNGVPSGSLTYCTQYFTASPGDTVTGQVGSQEVINSTAGNTFYTILVDFNRGRACEHAYAHTYGKEYFADFFAERPQYGSSYDNLPKFTNFQFYDISMSCQTCGVYPNYNNGYGFGSYMYNNGFQETTTKPMYENSGSTLGHFYIDWNSSEGISHYLYIYASPGAGGRVSPSSQWYNYGSSVSIQGTPNGSYKWCYWAGTGSSSYSGTTNPQTITMNSNVTEIGVFALGICPNAP